MHQRDIDKFVAEFDKIGEYPSGSEPEKDIFQTSGYYYQESIAAEPGVYYTVLVKPVMGTIAATALKFYPDNIVKAVAPKDIDDQLIKRALRFMGLIR